MRKLLGGRPIRVLSRLALGYDSQLGFIHEVHTPSSTDATGRRAAVRLVGPRRPARPSTLTLPLGGGGLLGINVHEIVVRLRLPRGHRARDRLGGCRRRS